MNYKGLGPSGNCGLKRSYPCPDDRSSSPPQRSGRFDELLDRFGKEPHALSEHDMSELVCECMSHGDVEALRMILKAQPMHTLDISRPADERAWWTLLGDLPEPCSIKALKLGDQQFTNATAALFLEAAGRMRHLESLRLHSCNWNLQPGELTCPPLPSLQKLHIEKMWNPLPLLNEIFKASQVSKFHFASNPGMADEDHRSLANLLIAQCNAKLRKLALRDLQARDQTLQGLFEHYVAFLAQETATPTHLDLSRNKLSPHTCTSLAEALKHMTAPLALTLAGCWPRGSHVSDWMPTAKLIGLQSLVKLDLSRNHFPWTAVPVFTQFRWHQKLRHLDLHAAIMEGANPATLAYSLGKLKLTSLCLPRLDDGLYAHFLDAMRESLLFLRVDGMEELRMHMPDEFHWLYPNYEALMACVDSNWRKWEGAVPLVEEGMRVFLSHLGRAAATAVPLDVARHAAEWAIDMNGAQTESLSFLNESSRPKVLASGNSFPVDKN
jgi:hypothetical protein